MTESRDQTASPIPGTSAAGFRVMVAGGGVAALEAVLALAEHRGIGIEVELICPEREFTLRSLSVAEPFGVGAPRGLDIEGFCRDHGARFRADSIAEIWGEQQRVLLASGEEVFYDALLLSLGARQRAALPGARPFRGRHDVGWFSEMLEDLERGSLRHLAFAVPKAVRWSLPLYELALMTAHRCDQSGSAAELTFVTHEPAPLEVFGARISEHIAGLLGRSGIELIIDSAPLSFDGEVLHCENGRRLDTHRVVTLPALTVPEIPGLPQGRNGFIGCDPEMRVDGVPSVWAAGDATWFPIKQGGLAAQQAEVAVAGIAVAAAATEVDVDVEPEPFRPVIRGALLTGGEPQFLRADLGEDENAALSTSPLWWPPIKVAGPRLAPYLAREWGGVRSDPLRQLEDLEVPAEDQTKREDEHRAALQLSLSFADVDAREEEFESALRWLDIAERLNVTLPAEYVERRSAWQRDLRAGRTSKG